MTPTADAHVRAQVSPQYRCFVFVKSRDGGFDDDNKHGADGIAETHDKVMMTMILPANL